MIYGRGLYGSGIYGAPVPPFSPPASAPWSFVRQVILATVLLCSELNDGCVVWDDQIAPFVDPITKTVVKLSLMPSRRTGWSDDSLFVDNGAGGMCQVTKGLRYPTLSVRCDCFDGDDAATALPVLERIRTRLAWQSARQMLLCADICRSLDTDIQRLDVKTDNRITSSGIFDVMLSIAITQTDARNPISWIESANTITEG